MSDTANNPWLIGIVTGIISSIIGGLILAALKSQGNINLKWESSIFSLIAKLLAYAMIMMIGSSFIIKWVYNVSARDYGFFPPLAWPIGITAILFVAVVGFSILFFDDSPFN